MSRLNQLRKRIVTDERKLNLKNEVNLQKSATTSEVRLQQVNFLMTKKQAKKRDPDG